MRKSDSVKIGVSYCVLHYHNCDNNHWRTIMTVLSITTKFINARVQVNTSETIQSLQEVSGA
jgi:hypothetical protein